MSQNEASNSQSMIDSFPPRRLKRPFIFELPLEVRYIIYHLVQQERALYKFDNEPEGSLTGSYLFRYGSPRSRFFPAEHNTLLGLRATNRQLYLETASFTTYPKMFMRIPDDLAFESQSTPTLQEFMSNKFALENIITVQIHIARNGKYLNRSPYSVQWERRASSPSPSSFIALRATLESFTTLFKRPKLVNTKPLSLKPLISIMEACPELNIVVIVTDDPDFYDRWEDPVGDLEAFLPLLKRKVYVQILQFATEFKDGETHAGFLELLKLFPKFRGEGKVYLSRFGLMHCASLKIRPNKVLSPEEQLLRE